MGATAQLAAPRAADLDDAHVLVVGLAEQRERADLAGLRQRHVGRRHRQVLAHREVGDLLDLAAGRRPTAPGPRRSRAAGSRACCRSRTAGPTGRAPGAAPRARRGCRSAPGTPTAATRGRPRRAPLAPGAQRAGDDLDGVRDEALDRALHVDDLQVHAVGGDDALVGDLATGLGVERRAVEHDLAALAGLDLADGLAVDDEADDGGLAGQLAGRRGSRSPRCARRSRHTSVFACPDFFDFASALARWRCSASAVREALAVDLEALLGRHLQGQVDREAVGVVQLERLVARRACAPPDCLVRATAVSRMVVPAARVRRNASSSA